MIGGVLSAFLYAQRTNPLPGIKKNLKINLRLYRNWHTSTLQPFEVGMFKLGTSSRIRFTMSRIRCMRLSGQIKSTQKSGHALYSDTTECDPNYCNAAHEHLYKRSCLRVCLATIRLSHNVSHVILQRFTIITRYISFNLAWLASSIYIL